MKKNMRKMNRKGKKKPGSNRKTEVQGSNALPAVTLALGATGDIARLPNTTADTLFKIIKNAQALTFGLRVAGGPGDPVAIGPTPSSNTFSPTEVLYYPLNVQTDYSYSYPDNSGRGIYHLSNGGTIDQPTFSNFLNYVRSGNLANANLAWKRDLYNYNPPDAPNIEVKRQCHVVVKLSGIQGLQCRVSGLALKTFYSWTDYYGGLLHLDADGTTYPSAPDGCTIFYFCVTNATDVSSTRGDAQFNMYLEIDQSNYLQIVVVDPFIKNRG
jgi:hypothetical protein